MDQSEYIAVLWKVVAAQGAIISMLIGALWYHKRADDDRAMGLRIELQRCKDALGINGSRHG